MFKLILIIIAGGLTATTDVDVSQQEYRFETLELCQTARQFFLTKSNEFVTVTAACFQESEPAPVKGKK